MLNVIILGFIIISVIMLSVVVPEKEIKIQQQQLRKAVLSFESIITPLND
jgi:hypothetical protein